MLKLNCLIKDTSAVDDIKDAVRVIVGERLSEDKTATFPQIYTALRGEGLEIDAESAGFIYNELYGQYKDGSLSTPTEVSEFAGKDIEDTQKALVNKITSEGEATESQIGKLSPEKNLANNIAKLFDAANYPKDSKELSVMKQMETLINKAVRSLLPNETKTKVSSINDSLGTFFETEKEEFPTLQGGINNLKTLFGAFKDEVDLYKEQVSSKLSDEDAEIFNQQWDKYTESVINSAYDIMLGKSDQNKLLDEALKNVKVDGINIVDNNGNIKWNSLIEFNDPNTISDNVKKLFEEGFKDSTGNEQKYTREQAQRIGDYFQRLYEAKLASVIQRKIANDRISNASAKNIISDFLKDQGFLNLVKDKEGKLLLTTANWKDMLNSIKDKVGNVDVGLQKIKEKLVEFLENQKYPSGENKFSPEQINTIIDEFEKAVQAKLLPGTADPSAIDRLIALNNVNGGKSFELSKQSALNKVAGVPDLSQSTLNQIRDLVNAAQKIIYGQNVSGDTIDNISKNKGAYAFQMLAQIDRNIKELLRANFLSKSDTQKIVKSISDILGAENATLLINPGNFSENILTGFGTNIAESISLFLLNPKLASMVIKKAQSDFWKSFISHASGGADASVINEQDLNPELSSGERLRYRSWFNDLKSGDKERTKKAIFGFPSAAVNIIYRMAYNSFDSGFNAAILRKKVASSMFTALKDQGYTGNQAMEMMMDAVNISKEDQADIDKQNEEITRIMHSVYLNPTKSDIEQNKRDMQLALYENAIQSASSKVTPARITDITKSIIEGAANQAKTLTGKKQIPSKDPITWLIYGAANGALLPQKGFANLMKEQEKRGNLKGAAMAQLGETLWKNTLTKFVGGVANFLSLSTTSTPYGFIMSKSLSNQAKRLSEDTKARNILEGEPGDIRKYAEFYGLARSMAVRAAMGTFIPIALILKYMAEGDDDDGVLHNLMQTKYGRRIISKFMPLGMAAVVYAMEDVDDPNLDTEYERLLELASNLTNKGFDQYSTLVTDVHRAKDSEGYKRAFAKAASSLIPSINVDQDEQFYRFITTIQSAVNKDKIEDVKEQERITKELYKNMEDWMDVIMVNGLIGKAHRIASPDEKSNRYKPDY